MTAIPQAKKTEGFTLVELMISMAIMGIVMAAVFMAYRSQERSRDMQEQVVSVQESLRGIFFLMEKEIRMAGYDPTGTANARIVTATPGRLGFTSDFWNGAANSDGDGDTLDGNENVTYGFSLTVDADDDGIPTAASGVADFARRSGAASLAYLPIAENIEAINFAYAYDADNDGDLDTYTDISATQRIIWAQPNGGVWCNLDANNDGTIDVTDAGGCAATTTTVNLADIRAVRVWVLGRAAKSDANYANTNSYVVGRQLIVAADNFRRRLTEIVIKCRNTGL